MRLAPRPGCSTYINANHVTLGDDERYICTQAPLPSTCDDFWRMCWEQDCRVIVMLCNLTERKKVRCHRYWPVKAGETQHYGGVAVALVKAATLPGLQLRRFQLLCGGVARIVTQLHYTEWPDFGVPDDTDTVRCIVEMYDYYTRGGGTGIVHCSAGIGRTGSFVAIHACLRALQRRGACDVRAVVASMRRQRLGMVQTAEQYLFVYQALRDACNARLSLAQSQDGSAAATATTTTTAMSSPAMAPQQQQMMQQQQQHQHEGAHALCQSGTGQCNWETVRLNMSASDLHVARVE